MRCCIWLFLLIGTCGLSSCAGFFTSPTTVIGITLSPTNPTLRVGSTEQFSATGTESNGDTKDVSAGATWTSSKPSVATISSTGLATAVVVGTTTVTVKYEDGETQSFITVRSASLEQHQHHTAEYVDRDRGDFTVRRHRDLRG